MADAPWWQSTSAELPDAAPDATGLTPRQQRILNVLRESIEKRGYPPSIREIGELVGLTSSSSVAHQLRVLEQKGFIKRDPNRPRALEVFIPELMAARRALEAADDSGFDPTGIGDAMPAADHTCPWSAGSPPAARSWPRSRSRRSSRCPRRWSARAPSSCSRSPATRWSTPRSATATTSSCAGADGRERRHRRGHARRRGDGQDLPAQGRPVWLMPHNDAYDPIDGTYATILGKVTAVLRRV